PARRARRHRLASARIPSFGLTARIPRRCIAVATSLPVSAPVRRVLARDDLLVLAEDAQQAVGIVREKDGLARRIHNTSDLFAVALGHHLDRAENAPGFAIR